MRSSARADGDSVAGPTSSAASIEHSTTPAGSACCTNRREVCPRLVAVAQDFQRDVLIGGRRRNVFGESKQQRARLIGGDDAAITRVAIHQKRRPITSIAASGRTP